MHKEKGYVCDICGFKTNRGENLTRHKLMHKEKRLKCMFCDFSSSRKEQLECHMDRRHQDVCGELSHMCSECGQGFIYKNSLTKHLSQHKKGPIPFPRKYKTFA